MYNVYISKTLKVEEYIHVKHNVKEPDNEMSELEKKFPM
jgi:hypothetical protein